MSKEAGFGAPWDGCAHSGAGGEGVPCGAAAPPRVPPADDVYLEHAVLLRRVAISKFSVPPEDAEGLVHDVFLNYILNKRAIHTDLRAYLIGGICNACRYYWRSRKYKDRLFDDEHPSVAELLSDKDLFEGVARTMVVASTLARLGPRCREVLQRYYLDGEDSSTIAAALNTSPGNVNYLMHVCRKKARDIYNHITKVPA